MVSKVEIPQDKSLDSSLALMTEGYRFISNRCKQYHSNVFQTRLLGQQVICMKGEECAELFYDNDRFERNGAIPNRIKQSIFGKDGVQTYDGKIHQHRKSLFMSLITAEQIEIITEITRQQWEIAIDDWKTIDELELYTKVEEIMCRVACQWAGVPLWAKELKQRTKDLSAMIDSFGAIGPRHWRGRMARNRTESWIRGIIRDVRVGTIDVNEETPLYTIAWHNNLDGNLMSTQMAAVELINILRPIVAIARYITFSSVALHNYPETKEKLTENNDEYAYMFVQEVRRFYPFGPFLGARVRKDFKWNGYEFKQGTLVLLDIYGTNHDPDIWDKPEEFNPERFKNWNGSPFNFIPQGGGEYEIGHRCAGEWITIEIMKKSLEFLTKKIEYTIPEQNLNFSMIRIPSIPRSRMIIKNVRRK